MNTKMQFPPSPFLLCQPFVARSERVCSTPTRRVRESRDKARSPPVKPLPLDPCMHGVIELSIAILNCHASCSTIYLTKKNKTKCYSTGVIRIQLAQRDEFSRNRTLHEQIPHLVHAHKQLRRRRHMAHKLSQAPHYEPPADDDR
jgi:hypothetical protein